MRSSIATQRSWVVGGVAAGVIWTAAKLTIPLLAAAAIDDGMRHGDQGKVIRLTLVMVAVGIVQAICTGLRRFAAFRIALRTETDLRHRLFAHLQRLHFAFHDQAQTGQLMARANTDIQQVQTVVILIPLTIASLLTMSSGWAPSSMPGALTKSEGEEAQEAQRAFFEKQPPRCWPEPV